MYFWNEEMHMRETTFTELRNQAKQFFDLVESGEIVRVLRNGKPIAEIHRSPGTCRRGSDARRGRWCGRFSGQSNDRRRPPRMTRA